MSIHRLLLRPEKFMETRDEASVWATADIVLATGLVNALTTAAVFVYGLQNAPVSTGTWAGIGVTVVLSGLFPVLTWGITTWLFLLIGSMFHAWGDFRELLTYTGWAFGPQLVASILTSGAYLLTISGMDPAGSIADLPSFLQAVRSDALVSAVTTLSLGLGLLTTTIWVFAVSEVLELSLREAVYTVAGPAVVWMGILAMDAL